MRVECLNLRMSQTNMIGIFIMVYFNTFEPKKLNLGPANIILSEYLMAKVSANISKLQQIFSKIYNVTKLKMKLCARQKFQQKYF